MVAMCQSQSTARLSELLRGHVDPGTVRDLDVSGLSCDSREVKPGDLFFARHGAHFDGADFADIAVKAGAVALVGTNQPGRCQTHAGVPWIGVADLDGCLGDAAHRFFGEPSKSLTVAGVTGTNGKSTVCHFVTEAFAALRSIAPAHGRRGGLIGTLGYGPVGALRDLELTTPDVITVHRILAEFQATGIDIALMEVSSHALSQQRVASVEFDVAVFTNLTRDHLDYHGNMSSYGEAKRQLFIEPGLKAVVVNSDDPFAPTILDQIDPAVRVLTYGFEANIAAIGVPTSSHTHVGGEFLAVDANATRLRVTVRAEHAELTCRIIGRFNGANILASIATLLALDVPFLEAIAGTATVSPLPGRMQPVAGGAEQPLVIVDYSHTPDALDNALRALREVCPGKLWCVFGCGGDRDQGKRPMMALAAQAHADAVVVTDDNPRYEDADQIVADICEAFSSGPEVFIERDRRKAIGLAVARATSTDAVLVAGKGHEAYQEVAGVRHPFSDAQVVRDALTFRASVAGGGHDCNACITGGQTNWRDTRRWRRGVRRVQHRLANRGTWCLVRCIDRTKL